MAFSKKGGAEDKPLTILIPLIMALLFLVIVVGFFTTSDFLTVEYWDEVGCWATNGLACGGGVSSWLPTSCTLTIADEPINNETLTEMLKDTWWMYHQNECDYGWVGDEIALVYSFEVEENILINDLFQYMITHNDGKKVESITYSDLNKLEENSEEFTLCFDKGSSTIASGEFVKNTPYYIMFFDDQGYQQRGDKIIISEKSSYLTPDEDSCIKYKLEGMTNVE